MASKAQQRLDAARLAEDAAKQARKETSFQFMDSRGQAVAAAGMSGHTAKCVLFRCLDNDSGGSWSLDPHDALDLARWIVDTFGEPANE